MTVETRRHAAAAAAAAAAPASSAAGGASAAAEDDNAIFVAVRVRPMNEKEKNSGLHSIVQTLDEHVVAFDPPTADRKAHRPGVPGSRKCKNVQYAFDRVFDESATQEQVYEHTTRPLLDALLEKGFNCSVFAYGATGAGKTHTMLGYAGDPGVMVLTMAELFQRIEACKLERSIEVTISMLEVYNETIRDILASPGSHTGSLDIREDTHGQITINGLSEYKPTNAAEVLELLARGNNNRTVNPTEMNAVSSRSHAVLQIHIKQRMRDAGIRGEVQHSKLSMIDLAGSERASATKNTGERLTEGANINRSLLALANCINALGDGKKAGGHVPYRDSKLTRLLKDSLGGNCKTVMITNVSPSAMHYEDTHNTLKYANRAKEIKMKVERNVVSVEYHVSQYTTIIKDLQAQVKELRERLASGGGLPAGTARVAAADQSAGLALPAPSTHLDHYLQQVQQRLARKRDLRARVSEINTTLQHTRYLRWLSTVAGSDLPPVAEPNGFSEAAMQALEAQIAEVDAELQHLGADAQRMLSHAEAHFVEHVVGRAAAELELARRSEELRCASMMLDNQVQLFGTMASQVKALQEAAISSHSPVDEEHLRPLEELLRQCSVASPRPAATSFPEPVVPSAADLAPASPTMRGAEVVHDENAMEMTPTRDAVASPADSPATVKRVPLRTYNLRSGKRTTANIYMDKESSSPQRPSSTRARGLPSSPSLKRLNASHPNRRQSLIPVLKKGAFVAAAAKDGRPRRETYAPRPVPRQDSSRRASMIPQRVASLSALAIR